MIDEESFARVAREQNLLWEVSCSYSEAEGHKNASCDPLRSNRCHRIGFIDLDRSRAKRSRNHPVDRSRPRLR